MSEQQHKQKQNSSSTEETVDDTPSVQNTELDETTADLLDDIDSVLEANAEQFVQEYVQKGGQ